MRMPSSSDQLTPKRLSEFFYDLYDDAPRPLRMLVSARPYVCPYDKLASFVPQGASMLDLGCGTGTLLAVLAAIGRISRGTGCDVAEPPLGVARRAAQRIGASQLLDFNRIDRLGDLPDRTFDVVAMVDVLHHIPPAGRAEAIEEAARRTAHGGIFLYKDMTDSPRWRRIAHTIDDLIFSHELVQQVREGEVEAWAAKCGLALEHAEYIPRYVYGHQLRVFRKT